MLGFEELTVFDGKGLISTIDINGDKCEFLYKYGKVKNTLNNINGLIFKVFTKDGDIYHALSATLIDYEDGLKVVMINHYDLIEYVKKGIPEYLIPKIADLTNKVIYSSSCKIQKTHEDELWLENSAKYWNRIMGLFPLNVNYDTGKNLYSYDPNSIKIIEENCFFNIKEEPLLYEGEPALNYKCILKESDSESNKFLGIKRNWHEVKSNREVFDVGRRECKELHPNKPKVLYAATNNEQNEFMAFLIGESIINVLNHQTDKNPAASGKLIRLFDFIKKVDLSGREAEFIAFINNVFKEYFIGIRVINGYDMGKSVGIGFFICIYTDTTNITNINVLLLSYEHKIESIFGNFFKVRLFTFIYHYFNMYSTSFGSNEAIKPVLFNLLNIDTEIGEVKENLNERIKILNLNEKIDNYIKEKKNVRYSILIDILLNVNLYPTTLVRREKWTKISNVNGVNKVYLAFQKLEPNLLNHEKKINYEKEQIEKFESIKKFIESK